jgi:NTP pyrophosphatase (non-canonical NTP hydrolase)
LRDELGDVLWYLSALATELDTNLSSVADKNIQKLFSRKERGVLKGSGDNR